MASVQEERTRLLALIRNLSLKRGRFVLASGTVSDTYLDLRLTTTHSEGVRLASRLLLREAQRLGVNRIGGPTLGADPLVGAAVAMSPPESDLRGFMVRGQTKDHGTGKRIEGHLEPGDRALLLDDVVTAGGSILRALEAVREAGGEVAGSWCLVDRGQGGGEKLESAGAPLRAVFSLEEVLRDPSQDPPDSASLEGVFPAGTAGEDRPFHRPATPLLTVDAIVEVEPATVLLVERRFPPFGWALPGGFVEIGESAEEAVVRECLEEIGLRLEHPTQMHTYSAPGRDPRLPTASVVFLATAHGAPRAGDDAGRVASFPLNGLPDEICFDHRRILEDFKTGRFGPAPRR